MATSSSKIAITKKPVWFITGCSTGFGRHLAKRVLGLGYRTVVTARKPAEVKDLEDEGHALVLKLDVTNQEEINAAIKTAEAKFGQIDVLVNKASAILPLWKRARKIKFVACLRLIFLVSAA